MKINTTGPLGISLFKLTTRIKDTLQTLLRGTDPDTGEISDETTHLLAEMELKEEAEVLDAACAVRELEELEVAFTRQLERLAARKKTLQGQQTYLRGLIERAVPAGTKLGDERVSIGWRKSTQTAVPVDAEELPKKYTRIKVEADKAAIKKALTEGKSIEGCALVTVQNLQIE